MSDLYHGEYPVDMTTAEARHTLAEQQHLNDRIEAEAARMASKNEPHKPLPGNLGSPPTSGSAVRPPNAKVASDTGAGLQQALAKEFRDASRGYGRAGTAEMRDGPYMSMDDAAGVYADLMLDKAASDVGEAFDLDSLKKLWRTGVETGRILQQADAESGFNEQAWAEAVRETDRHCYDLDITNADHIVLWLEHQLNGHVGPLAYIACRILDAHEAALATPTDATDGATGGGEAWRQVLSNLIHYVERTECEHEDTYRGGAIWTICRDCERKWADDQGGFQPYQQPKPLSDAYALLENSTTPATTPGGDLLVQAVRKEIRRAWFDGRESRIRYDSEAVEAVWDKQVARALKPAGDGGEA